MCLVIYHNSMFWNTTEVFVIFSCYVIIKQKSCIKFWLIHHLPLINNTSSLLWNVDYSLAYTLFATAEVFSHYHNGVFWNTTEVFVIFSCHVIIKKISCNKFWLSICFWLLCLCDMLIISLAYNHLLLLILRILAACWPFLTIPGCGHPRHQTAMLTWRPTRLPTHSCLTQVCSEIITLNTEIRQEW